MSNSNESCNDVWSEIIHKRINEVHTDVHGSYPGWYPREQTIDDLINISKALNIDAEELVRAHLVMKNAIHNIKIHAKVVASLVKFQNDKLRVKQVFEDVT